jgi:hypothetical protein
MFKIKWIHVHVHSLFLGSSSVLLGGQTFVFGKFVSTVGHDQQNLGRFCWGLTQGWYFAIENY